MKKKVWIITAVVLIVSVALTVLLLPHWRKVTKDHRHKEYAGQWLDQETAGVVKMSRMEMTIREIYSDCFFGMSQHGEVKVNGALSDEWCVNDRVYVYFVVLYMDSNDRFEGELEAIHDVDDDVRDDKPVLYLYPQRETEVSVKLELDGKLTCTYPAYQDGWRVTAKPDGTLIDDKGQTYNYLYWEGETHSQWDMTTGFCVRGEDTAAFLEGALAKQGLNRREANEFIVYWLPLMEGNAYNIISFQTDVYTEAAKLEIDPAPDTLIRVFMAWRASDQYVAMEEQKLTAPERTGFTVVEWGGSKIG